MKKRTVYRDTKTGRFVAKKKWERSKSDRYKRQRIPIKKRKIIGGEPRPPIEGEVHEYVISFSYGKSGRSFDVIVTATSDEQAREVAKEFLSGDKNGQKIVKAGFHGWSQFTARGKSSDQEAGEAEYRSDSEAD